MAQWDPEEDTPYNFQEDRHRLTKEQDAECRLGGVRYCTVVLPGGDPCDADAEYTEIKDPTSKRFGVSYVRCHQHGCLDWHNHAVGWSSITCGEA